MYKSMLLVLGLAALTACGQVGGPGAGAAAPQSAGDVHFTLTYDEPALGPVHAGAVRGCAGSAARVYSVGQGEVVQAHQVVVRDGEMTDADDTVEACLREAAPAKASLTRLDGVTYRLT